jgi:hypothetical protein
MLQYLKTSKVNFLDFAFSVRLTKKKGKLAGMLAGTQPAKLFNPV